MFRFFQETIKMLGRWALSTEKQTKVKAHWGNVDNCGICKLY